jgi:hypothetical protein
MMIVLVAKASSNNWVSYFSLETEYYEIPDGFVRFLEHEPHPQAHLQAQYRHHSHLLKCPHQGNRLRRSNRTEGTSTGAYVNFPQM